MHAYARDGNVAAVKALVQAGADVNEAGAPYPTNSEILHPGTKWGQLGRKMGSTWAQTVFAPKRVMNVIKCDGIRIIFRPHEQQSFSFLGLQSPPQGAKCP